MLKQRRTTAISAIIKQKVSVVLVVLAVAGIGLYLLQNSQASTSTVAVEAETGITSNGATVITDSMASGSKAVRFSATSVGSIDETFVAAWDSANHETLRSWFDANTAGPTGLSGTHAGGMITTQAQADVLAGKTITGPLIVNGTVVLRDFVMQKATMTITGGTVKVQNVLIDAQYQTTADCGYLNIKGGNVDLYRVQIRGAGDGIRMTSSPTVSSKYLYIHSPATAYSCNGHHDGIQVMGGSASFQRTFVDYTNGPPAGQGILVKADSQDIKDFRYNYSFFTGGGNSMTFEPTAKGYPDVIDLSNVLAAKGCSKNLFSLYLTSAEQAAMVTKWSVKISPSGAVIQAKNGIVCSSL